MDEGYFMAFGAVGISLAGFAGLFSALQSSDHQSRPAVYRWRIREIVTSSFVLAFVGFGTVALYAVVDDVTLTARVISLVAAVAGASAAITSTRPGPAWPDERDRLGARIASLVLAAVVAGNVVVGTEPYLQVVMLILLLRPSLVFIRAVIDASKPAADTADLGRDPGT